MAKGYNREHLNNIDHQPVLSKIAEEIIWKPTGRVLRFMGKEVVSIEIRIMEPPTRGVLVTILKDGELEKK